MKMDDVTNGESLFPNFDPTKDLSKAPKQRTKRGLGARPLLESEIKDVQQKARSAAEAARMLGVSYNTYKKYAKEYGVFEDLKNPHGIGIRKGTNPGRAKKGRKEGEKDRKNEGEDKGAIASRQAAEKATRAGAEKAKNRYSK